MNLRAEHLSNRRGVIDKEFIWPDSFGSCTPKLRMYRNSIIMIMIFLLILGEVVERWFRHHFSRVRGAKCLIIIGPTGCGKTTFSLSLPNHVNYFKGRWRLDSWSDYARYSVYDDVPWDDFEKLNYPSKDLLLTQKGEINVS